MNAHQRRQRKRAEDRKAANAMAEQGVPHKARVEPQSKTTDMTERDKLPNLPTNLVAPPPGRVLRYAKWTGKWLWKSTLFFGFWLGIISGYYGLEQRVSVSQGEPLDDKDPFSTPFIVSNDGPLPIENVTFRCGIGHTSYKNGPKIQGAENFSSSFIFAPGGKLPAQNFGASEMNPGERSTIPSCGYPFPPTIEAGDIGIVVSYRVGHTPIRQTRIFRFGTLPDANNKLHWFPYPIK